MSTPAAAVADATDVAPRKKGMKKLILIALAALLLLALVGGAALVFLKKRAAAAEDEGDAAPEAASAKVERVDPKVVPAFVALDMFTVNLADREAERYAQVGITLELVDTKATDQIKNYMPAIRNNILLVLASKSSQELLDPEGKRKLAEEIQREAVRPLGFVVEAPEAAASGAKKKAHASHDDDPPPIKRVHFSNFIIQ